MTREEAIEILWRYDVNFEPHPPEEVMHAIDMAIEALSAEASSDLYKRGFEDAKRAFELEFAREAESIRKRNAQLEVMLNAQKAISADAVQVVRCKDCKWHMKDYMGEWCGKLRKYPGMKANDFCSYGERREESEVEE